MRRFAHAGRFVYFVFFRFVDFREFRFASRVSRDSRIILLRTRAFDCSSSNRIPRLVSSPFASSETGRQRDGARRAVRGSRLSGPAGRRSRLADGFQRSGLRAWILNDAVAHAGHPVAGSAQPVSLSSSVGPRVPVADPLQSGADLRLAANHREDQHALERVYHVGEVPDVLRTTDCPRDHVSHPSDAHHHHEFHAHAAQCGSETETLDSG